MLIYGVILVIAGLLTKVVNTIHSLPTMAFAGVWLAIAVALDRLVGHAPRGKALRPVIGPVTDDHVPDPPSTLECWKRWYLETPPRADALPHSCSFVEFDERGDFLDFAQHRHAYLKIMALAGLNQPLAVVVYVHGWRHSGQSHDVIAFNEFLHQLAGAGDGHVRVHGVYLAWRGAALKHVLDRDKTFADVARYYGGTIVDFKRRAPVGWLNDLLESASYFDRKSVPEHKFSGTSIARTIFSCAYAAKRSQGHPDRQVLLAGHSFGGLMLERTFQNAAVGQLEEEWPWGDPAQAGKAINPLPFDTVLLLNSAAPSIYAKQFQSYFAAHRQAMLRAGVPHANIPMVFSLTSSADWATGVAHPVANRLSVLLPTLWRHYGGSDFTLERIKANRDVEIPQSFYYRHTPGHNPLLVNRFIEPATHGAQEGEGGTQVRRNLRAPSRDLRQLTLFQTAKRHGSGSWTWQIRFPPRTSEHVSFSSYRGRRPLVWTEDEKRQYIYRETAYWIIRCPGEIIAGHNDIWSQAAMDTYAALHRIALEAAAPTSSRA